MNISAYLTKRKLALDSKTLKVHESILKHFEEVTGSHDREPTLEDVERYILLAMDESAMGKIGKKPIKKTTLANNLRVVKQYFIAMRLPDRDDLHDIFLMMRPRVRQDDYRRAVLTEKEVRKVIAKSRPPYDIAFVLGYCHCRRITEILMLRGTDVHRTHITYNILKKGDTVRRDVPLDLIPDQYRDRLLDMAGKNVRVVPRTKEAVEYAFRRALKEARINKPATFHSLRHSIICHLLDRGVPARVVKDQLSFHESIDIIYRIYGRIPSESEFRIGIDWI